MPWYSLQEMFPVSWKTSMSSHVDITVIKKKVISASNQNSDQQRRTWTSLLRSHCTGLSIFASSILLPPCQIPSPRNWPLVTLSPNLSVRLDAQLAQPIGGLPVGGKIVGGQRVRHISYFSLPALMPVSECSFISSWIQRSSDITELGIDYFLPLFFHP